MFLVNKTVTVQTNRLHNTSVDIPILELIEGYLKFKPYLNEKGIKVGGLSHLEKKELPALKPNTRRFFITRAYSNKDK